MVKCKRCKNPLPETARYCPNCGQVRNPDRRKKGKRKQNEFEENTHVLQTDFGNYYDDVIPEDAEELKSRKGDSSLTVKLVLLGFGVVLALAACITLLILFGGGTL